MHHIPVGQHSVNGNVFSILAEDRRKHMAIFGKSGAGKTTLLRNMAALDIRNGLGVTVIDPHGGLVRELLELIPRQRTNDVIYFNPLDPDRVIGLNVLEPTPGEQKSHVVSALISILRNVWPSAWGPRTEYILSNVAFALLEQSQPVTLLALPRMLTDVSYRKQVLGSVRDPAVRSFFTVFDKHWNDRFREEAIAPLANKVHKFTTPLLRPVIGQPRSSFDFRWLMDSGKILLCDLSKGGLGEDISSLLGSLIVTKLSLAALSRQNIPEPDRRPHILYADEIQSFIYGVNFPTILGEARKYALVLVVATQTAQLLPKETVSAIFANCATVVSFRVGGVDAQTLAREFVTTLPASELQDLPDYKIYLATLAAGRPSGPHLLNTFPPCSRVGMENDSERVVRTSLERFGRPRVEVEVKINKFLSR